MIRIRTARIFAQVSLSTLAVALGVATFTPDLQAQIKKADKALRLEARGAYEAGTQAFENGDFETAFAQFEKANAALPAPQAEFWAARSLDQLGRTEEAIQRYEVLLASPGAAKLGDEKIEIASTRLLYLKSPPPEPPPAEEPPMAEPEPEPVPEPEPLAAPEVTPLPLPAPANSDLEPQAHVVELRLFTGPLVVTRAHNLHEEAFKRRAYVKPAWSIGLSAAYFFSKYGGLEAEYLHAFGGVEDAPGAAHFNSVRGQVIAQLPGSRFTPFAFVGAGFLNGNSDAMGNDSDFLMDVGAGAKYAATPVFSPRLDVRWDMIQREGGGVSFPFEALIGATFTFGRD